MRWCLLFVALAFLGSAPAAHAAPVDATPGALMFTQDVTDGASAAQTSLVTNHTGSAGLVSVNGPSTANFTLVTDQLSDCSNQIGLFDGESCNVRVQFDPSSAGTATPDSVVVTVGSDSATVNLSGEGTLRALSASPGSAPFGSQSIGAGPAGPATISVTNTGTGPVTLTGAPGIAGTDASQFQLVSGSGVCTNGAVIPPAGGCNVYVTFDPSSIGVKNAQVNVPSNAPNPVQIGLTGTGIQAQLSRSPDTLDFTAGVKAGPSAPQVATITNSGSEAVPIDSVAISDPVSFRQLTGNPGDCTPSTTLAAGGTCELRIAFDPASKGQKSATITVNSSAAPISIALNGVATLIALEVPETLDFGALEVGAGATAIHSSTVTNTGTEPITLRSIRLKDPDTARFLWASGLSSDCAPGRTLAADETCELRVMYAPQSDGTKVGTVTVTSSVGVSTLLLTAAGTPGLAIPAFADRASRTQNRRLSVSVNPIGGTVSNIVVRVKSRSGAILGTGVLTRAGSERAVTVRLKSSLRPGRYVATASGRDLFADVVTAKPRDFRLR